MAPDQPGQRGLSRERLVEAALGLVQQGGLDGLSMRALADRLDVKAASIYWHVRDRAELLDLLAGSILESVRRPAAARGWRSAVVALASALGEAVDSRKDSARILLEAPDALGRSELFDELRTQLVAAGLAPAEAADVAAMVMTHAIVGRHEGEALAPATAGDAPAELAIDTGSRGVMVRAGPADMEALVRLPVDRSTAAPAVIRGEKVVVRRVRGVGRGELELNPTRPWRFHVQAPTWNTVLDARGLDVRGVHIDSGAARVEVFLPRPVGVVPVQVSGGVVGVVLHRPHGAAVVADLSTGAVQVKLDAFETKATLFDTHWESENAGSSRDRIELRVSGGAVRVELDSYTAQADAPARRPPAVDRRRNMSALDILLDGVEARAAGRRSGSG